jgi:hypothetical protein
MGMVREEILLTQFDKNLIKELKKEKSIEQM